MDTIILQSLIVARQELLDLERPLTQEEQDFLKRLDNTIIHYMSMQSHLPISEISSVVNRGERKSEG